MFAARDYKVSGAGTIGLDETVDFGGTLQLSPGLTRDLFAGVPIFSLVTDAAGVFRVPFRAGGKLPNVSVRPDTTSVTKGLGGAVGGVVRGAAGVVGGALGGIVEGVGSLLGGDKPANGGAVKRNEH